MSDKPETRTEFWHRRGRQLHAMRKTDLVALYRSLGGLGGIHPPEKWSKDDLVSSVADIEWRRLPDDAKKPAPVHMTAPCDICGKGEGATAHSYKGSHNYRHTYNPDQPHVPYFEYCAVPGCGLPYEHHEAWDLGHQYTAPAEEQPAPPAEATATPDAATFTAACTPNSLPVDGVTEHGYQLNVLDANMTILVTVDLPEWERFRPASAGHRLIEHGYMIRADARGLPGTVNGWTEVPHGSGAWMAPVVSRQDAAPAPAAQATYRYLERPSGPPVRVLVTDGPGCTPAVVPLRKRQGYQAIEAEDTAEQETQDNPADDPITPDEYAEAWKTLLDE